MPATNRFLGLFAAGALLLTGCGAGGEAEDSAGGAGAETTAAAPPATAPSASAAPSATAEDSRSATAILRNAEGEEVGTASFSETDGGTEVDLGGQGLEPGYYGVHVHTIGLCEPDSTAPNDPDTRGAFLSAGGHLASEGQQHPEHDGDLPSLLVTEAGEGRLVALTDRFTLEDLTDDDGSALMIHGGPENFANIPERYASAGPDEDTLRTGDAGSRLACGIIEEPVDMLPAQPTATGNSAARQVSPTG